MNQINTLQYATINGLKSLELDTLTTDQLNATNMYLQNLEVNNIIIDQQLEFLTDAHILANGLEISDIELSYLDGSTSNIQNQLNGLDTRVTTNENDIITLEDKTTKISYNSGTNTTTADSNFTVTGEFNATSELTLKNDPSANGFTFLLNNNNKILYFRVKDTAGNIRSFQIHHSQIFSNLPVYFDSNVTLPQSRILFLGENSNAIRFLANPDINAGMRYENRINNYYTNFLQRNGSGTDITVFRLHHTKLDSLIRHDFGGETNFNEITYLYKNLVFNHTNVKLVVLSGVEITQQELSYLTGLTSNIQNQINTEAYNISSLNTRVTTNENDISLLTTRVTTNETDITTLQQKTTKLSYNSGTDTTSLSSKLTVSGEATFNGMVNLNDNLYQYETTFLYKNLVFTMSGVKLLVLGGTVEITQQELSYLSGLTDDIQYQIDTINDKTNKISYDSVNDITTINSKVNINDTLTLQNVIHKPGTNYEIENTTNAGSIIFKVRDSGGTVRSITINQFTNVSGINDVGCNKVVMGGTTLRENGSVFSGAVTFNGSVVSNNSVTLNNGLSMVTGSLTQNLAAGIVQMSFLSTGTNTLKGSDFFGRINMSSTDPTQNRIEQNAIAGDTSVPTGNILKTTRIRQNTNATPTINSILQLFDVSTLNRYDFLVNSPPGGYNALVETNSMTVVGHRSASNNATVTYTCWASERLGMKIKTTSSTNHTLELWGGNATNMIMDSNTGTSMTNVNSIGFTGGKTMDGNFGNIYTATLLTSVSITDFTETTLSSGLVLPAGTYNISWNITFLIQTAGTTVNNCYGCYSTSTSAFTNNTILTSDYKGNTIPVNNVFSLTGQDYVHFASSTTIYLRVLVSHNKGANHVMFHDPFSHLKAIKIC